MIQNLLITKLSKLVQILILPADFKYWLHGNDFGVFEECVLILGKERCISNTTHWQKLKVPDVLLRNLFALLPDEYFSYQPTSRGESKERLMRFFYFLSSTAVSSLLHS